jgi:monomeric isocitrate dehydrogenase
VDVFFSRAMAKHGAALRAAGADARNGYADVAAKVAALPEPEVFALFRDVVDGLEVHVAKIAIDFQVLTGTEPDTDMLREALEEFLSG